MLKPEPGALAHILGREERIENLVADGWRDAGAGIADLDDDIVARTLDADGNGLTHAKRDVARRERQRAAAFHRIAGVDGKVDQCRTQLRPIDQGRPRITGEIGHDLDMPAEGQ